jgi:RNA recognition motif-containing protein
MRLFVGILPHHVTTDDLKDLFSQAGQVVSSHIMMDRATGEPRGFGFVVMISPEAGQAAIQQLHDRNFEGHNLVVNVAKPKQERR